jgi:GTPase SAR1 family protein
MAELSWIFVIGAAAAGKSTFAREVCRQFPQLTYSSDLPALKELFCLNDTITNYALHASEPSLGSLASSLTSLSYWPDLRDLRLTQLKQGELPPRLETSRTIDGGHSIHEPTVWDNALIRTVARLAPTSKHIIEFGRGYDVTYAEHYRITGSEIYPRSFRILISANRHISEESSVIIHLTTDHLVRMCRNEHRKLRGEHFVSSVAMEEVYATDPFVFEKLDCQERQDGRLSASLPIPVLTVDNNSDDRLGNFARSLRYLSGRLTR